MLTESYYHDTCYPLSPYTLPQLWEQISHRDTGNYILWADPYEKMTHKEICDQAMLIAKGLLALGLKRGDTLCCFGSQGSDPVLMFIACSSLGIKFMSSYLYFPIEKAMKMIISKAKPTAVLIGDAELCSAAVSSTFTDVINELANDKSAQTITHVLYDRKLENKADRLQNGWKSLSEVMSLGKMNVTDEELSSAKSLVEKNEPCLYTCTSGSTGEPKLVLIGAAVFANIGINCKLGFGKNAQVYGAPDFAADESYAIPQLAECMACDTNLVLFPLAVSPNGSEEIKSIWDAVDKHRIEVFIYKQYIVTQLVNRPEYMKGYDLSCLRAIIITATSSTLEFKQRVVAIAPDSIDFYGLTEFFYTAIFAPGAMKNRPTSVGLPLPNVEAKIVDDDGATVPVNTRGQLFLRGWPLFLEYKDLPELTAKAKDKDGWFMTGDLVSMDELGYLSIHGRLATAQRWKVQDEVVYSIGIESILGTHPKIMACTVAGTKSDGTLGDELNYVIVPSPGSGLTAREVKEFAVAKMNSCLQWPVRIFFYDYDQLPQTAGVRMKVDKVKLQEEIKARVKCDPTEGTVWDGEVLGRGSEAGL